MAEVRGASMKELALHLRTVIPGLSFKTDAARRLGVPPNMGRSSARAYHSAILFKVPPNRRDLDEVGSADKHHERSNVRATLELHLSFDESLHFSNDDKDKVCVVL